MRRTEARELFMQLLFQMEVQKDYSQKIKENYVAEYMKGADQLEYFNQLFDLISGHLPEIDQRLAATSDRWRPERMAKVDLAVLRLAAAEIFYLEDVPDRVAINEAVVLAKKFGGEDSGKFVNGILGKLSKEKETAILEIQPLEAQ